MVTTFGPCERVLVIWSVLCPIGIRLVVFLFLLHDNHNLFFLQNEDKKMRSLAVVPPVLLDSRERRLCFDNRNGLVEDPMAEYRERPLLNVWTEQVCCVPFFQYCRR